MEIHSRGLTRRSATGLLAMAGGAALAGCHEASFFDGANAEPYRTAPDTRNTVITRDFRTAPVADYVWRPPFSDTNWKALSAGLTRFEGAAHVNDFWQGNLTLMTDRDLTDPEKGRKWLAFAETIEGRYPLFVEAPAEARTAREVLGERGLNQRDWHRATLRFPISRPVPLLRLGRALNDWIEAHRGLRLYLVQSDPANKTEVPATRRIIQVH